MLSDWFHERHVQIQTLSNLWIAKSSQFLESALRILSNFSADENLKFQKEMRFTLYLISILFIKKGIPSISH